MTAFEARRRVEAGAAVDAAVGDAFGSVDSIDDVGGTTAELAGIEAKSGVAGSAGSGGVTRYVAQCFTGRLAEAVRGKAYATENTF